MIVGELPRLSDERTADVGKSSRHAECPLVGPSSRSVSNTTKRALSSGLAVHPARRSPGVLGGGAMLCAGSRYTSPESAARLTGLCRAGNLTPAGAERIQQRRRRGS